MNLWGIKKLKEDLANQTISQFDLLVYYLITGFLLAFLMYPTGIDFYDSYQGVNFKWIEWISTNSIYLLGLLICYNVNGGRGGKSFIDRILPLEIVLTLRYLVFLYIPLEIIWLLFFDGTTFSDVALLSKEIIFEVLLLIRVISCMKDIVQIEKSNQLT